MSYKSVLQECPRRVSHKSVLQECHLDIRSFSNVFPFGFVGSILFFRLYCSLSSVQQWFYTGSPSQLNFWMSKPVLAPKTKRKSLLRETSRHVLQESNFLAKTNVIQFKVFYRLITILNARHWFITLYSQLNGHRFVHRVWEYGEGWHPCCCFCTKTDQVTFSSSHPARRDQSDLENSAFVAGQYTDCLSSCAAFFFSGRHIVSCLFVTHASDTSFL